MRKFKYMVYSFLMIIGLASCDLVGNIDDIKPENTADENTLIRDENSANLALRGVYELWRATGISLISPGMGYMSGSLLGSGIDAGVFAKNDVKPETSSIADYYTALYRVVNYANTVMEQLEAGKAVGLARNVRMRLIGECKISSGNGTFFLVADFWTILR